MGRRPHSVFSTEIRRSITDSLGRFLAIAGIVALGCGFYAGLRMCGPDMRSAGDEFTDGTNLYDIRLVSTLGFSDNLVDDISGIDGVEAVMPGRSTDVMASLGSEQYAVRISTLPSDAATDSTVSDDGFSVESSDSSYLNRVTLKSGRLPTAKGECVLSADRVTDSSVGIGDTVTVLYGASDLTDVLDVREYTVVGFVSSSNYISSTSMGSTTLGSGLLGQYLYVTDDNFSDACPYTEVYVKAAGAQDEVAWSDAYQDKVDATKDNIEAALPQIKQERQDELRADAQTQLDDQKASFESEKADANAQLDDAKSQLDDAAATLADSKATLEDGEASYADGVSQLAEKRTEAADQLASGQATIDEKNEQLDEAQTTLDAQLASWNASTPSYDAGDQANSNKAGLEQKRQELQGQRDTYQAQLDALVGQAGTLDALDASKAKLDAAISQLEAQLATLTEGTPEYAAVEAQLEAAKKQLGDVTEAISAETKLTDGISQLDSGIASLTSGITEAESELSSAQTTIDDGRAQVSSAQSTLDAQRSSATAQLDEAQATLDSSRAQLDDGWDQLASGQADYDSGLAEWQASRDEADAQLADAQAKIDDAQAQIDDISQPDIYTLDRTQNYGAESYISDSRRMDNIAAIFPLFFFIVAALVALTTMTRMVESDRTQIGCYKALGYSTARISSKYLVYAAVASVVGGIVGIFVLSQVLPMVVMNAYGIIYNVPSQPFPLGIDPVLGGLSLAAGVGITLLATWVAVVATLRETPAALMQPKAPKAGKRILLERIGPLWRRTSFTWKVTFRNLFRYKRRLLMCVIGIAGCTALLLTGLGVRDAINDIIDNQFGQISHYDCTIGLDDDASEDDVQSVVTYLEGTGDVDGHARTQSLNKQLGSATHDSTVVQVTIPQDCGAFTGMVTFRDRLTHDPITLDDSSVILSEKLATTLGVGVGDTVELFDQDDVGNATGQAHELTVTGVTENYVGDLLYLGKDAYASTGEAAPAYTTVYASVTDDATARDQITSDLHDESGVSTVSYIDETIESYRTMLRSMDIVMVVLVVSAAALAFIVLFDLTNINVEERSREIASLKVLGFTPREVNSYIFRETILLTLLGAVVGMPVGTAMEGFVVVTAEVDRIMFGRTIHPASYVVAFVLTLVFAVIVMLAMRRKLKAIDMVESLKSVD
jgi:putative ABC transport system permease protein